MFKLGMAQMPPIFGRSKEMCDVISYLINPKIQLISIIGLPGIGKTTITMNIALFLEERQRPQDGIIFISLSKIY